jgi:hypothetical protein
LAGLASLALQGANLWFEWFRAISAFAELIRANGFIGKGITPSALAYGLQAQDLAETAIVAGGAMLGLTCCWYVFTRTKDPALRGGALVCSSLLCTPYALTYEAASLLPAAAALLTGRHTGVATLMTAALVVCFPFSPLTVMFFAIGMIAHLSRKLPEEPAVELQLA